MQNRASGSALVELLIGLVLSFMLVACTGALWLYGTRSLAATRSQMELDAKIGHLPRLKPLNLQISNTAVVLPRSE